MISIVMSYFNRLNQLRYTLKTISQSQEKDLEIIIVEDFCDPEERLDFIQQEFPNLDITVIRMSDTRICKDYCNPCVPYNAAFRASRGDTIIIQNPECCHIGDVLQYTKNNLNDNCYLTFHCYAATKSETTVMQSGQPVPMFTDKKSRWYNHAVERPYAYHFTSAITRKNLMQLNGFDERFAQGQDMDDVEFIYRVKALGLELKFVEDPWVVHQYHRKTYDNPHNPPVTVNNRDLWAHIKENLQVRVENNGIDICGI
jgi:GT2 family glycosyltransferase